MWDTALKLSLEKPAIKPVAYVDTRRLGGGGHWQLDIQAGEKIQGSQWDQRGQRDTAQW